MKKFLLFIWLLLPISLLAQEATEPFADADLIITESNLNPAATLKQAALLLQEHGFFVQKYDPELMSITADKTLTEPSHLLMRVQIYIREQNGTRLHLFGDYKYGSSEGTYYSKARFQKGIFQKTDAAVFAKIDKLAKAFRGNHLLYSKLIN